MPATTGAEIVARAETGWPLDKVPYSQVGVWNDDDGRTDEDGYRRDCSGFASMAMAIPAPGLSTITLVNVARPIPWADLRPGDLVMLGGPGTGGNNGHVGVVVAVNAPTYDMLEQSGGLGPDRNTYRIGSASRPGMVPYRSIYVTEDDMALKGGRRASTGEMFIGDGVRQRHIQKPSELPWIKQFWGLDAARKADFPDLPEEGLAALGTLTTTSGLTLTGEQLAELVAEVSEAAERGAAEGLDGATLTIDTKA